MQKTLADIYKGWDEYQHTLVEAVKGLSPEQLALRAAPHLRSLAELVAHIVRWRARWFVALGVQDEVVTPYLSWDQEGAAPPSAEELVKGLENTWATIARALAGWSVSDLDNTVKASFRGKPYLLVRQWVIWHVVEHDLHHGGELFFSLGVHQLPTPNVGDVTGHVKEVEG